MNKWKCNSLYRRKINYYFRQRKNYRWIAALAVHRRPSWSTFSVVSPVLSVASSVGSNNMSEVIQWDHELTHEFLVLLVEHVATSHGVSMKYSNYNNISDQIYGKCGKKIEVRQLKSKCFRMRTTYYSWRALLHHTRFGWDEQSQTPICPTEIWQEYLKQNPGAKDFIHKGLVDKELYEVIFENQNATEPTRANIVISDSVQVDIDVEELEPDSDRITGEKRSNKSTHGRVIDKKKKCVAGHPLVGATGKLTDAISNRTMGSAATNRSIDGGTEEIASVQTDRYSLKICQEILTSMQLDLNIFLKVVKFLVDKPDWREILVNMTSDQREFWIYNDFCSM